MAPLQLHTQSLQEPINLSPNSGNPAPLISVKRHKHSSGRADHSNPSVKRRQGPKLDARGPLCNSDQSYVNFAGYPSLNTDGVVSSHVRLCWYWPELMGPRRKSPIRTPPRRSRPIRTSEFLPRRKRRAEIPRLPPRTARGISQEGEEREKKRRQTRICINSEIRNGDSSPADDG